MNQNPLTLRSYAKINLTLDVTDKRPDGYHEIKTIMHEVGLYDTVTLTREDKLSVSSNLPFLPKDARNLGIKAASAFFAYTGIKGGVHIRLQKRIPVSAGLAGGSGNAAAVLRGLNKLYDAGLSMDTLREIGRGIGADVPFCIEGGCCLAEGIGEVLTPITPLPNCFVLLCKPQVQISTAKIFKELDCKNIKMRPDTVGTIAALSRGDLTGVAVRMYNVLEDVTLRFCPQIGEIRAKMIDMGALGAIMSGSGPTVFGIFNDQSAAKDCQEALKGMYADTFLV